MKTATQCVFDLGRLVLLLAVIAQSIIFSAHISHVRADSRYYAIALVGLPMLLFSWLYFAKPPSDRTDPPKFVWLAYALTVVTFQTVVFGTTDVATHDSSLLYIANVLTPILFLVCIVCCCERSLKDASFITASGVAILNAFDVSDAFIVVARNGRKAPAGFWGGLVGIACVLLVWSALEFTIRSQLTRSQGTPVVITCGLHAVHLTINLALFALRAVLYMKGWMGFSIMISKNIIVFFVRLVYMVSIWWLQPTAQPLSVLVPTAPPPFPDLGERDKRLERPPTPLSSKTAQRIRKDGNQDEKDDPLYPVLPKHVHFEDEVYNK